MRKKIKTVGTILGFAVLIYGCVCMERHLHRILFDASETSAMAAGEETDKKSVKETDKQTDKQADKQTDKQPDKQTDTQVDKTVVIDAGHGGSDGGKIGKSGELEKEINLKIANKLKKHLEEAGMTVVMTRTNDDRLEDSQIKDLKARVKLINDTAPDLAVSIHQNSYEDERVHGAQMFYYTTAKDGAEAARFLQQSFQKLDETNTKKEKGNSTYYILKKTEVTTVIAECGFLSNPEEAKKLSSDEYQEKIALTLAEGIKSFFLK